MIKQIQILNDLIESTLHRVEITTGSIVDNGDNTWTFSACNTFYLNIGKAVTIDAIDYRITAFTLNTSLTVTPIQGTTPVTATGFNIDSPQFIHGSPMMINSEYLKGKTYPFIWLVQINTIKNDGSFNALVKSIMSSNLMFLMDCLKEDWLVDDHYTNAIYPLLNEINFFMNIIKKRTDIFGEEVNWDTIDHVNFGDYLVDKGNTTQILSDDVSGVQLQVELPYVIEVCDTCDTPIISKCFPTTINVNGDFLDTLQSGETTNLLIEDTLGATVGVIDSPTKVIVPAGGSPNDSSSQYKTGQTVSFITGDDGDLKLGGGVDFLTLDFTNPFGNTNRFTDDTGAQTYTKNLVVDWSSWNQATDTVLVWVRTPTASTFTAAMGGQPFTVDTKSGWFIPTIKELFDIFNFSMITSLLNYAPFSINANTTANRIWTSSPVNAFVAYNFANTASFTTSSYGTTSRYILRRNYTLAELGL